MLLERAASCAYFLVGYKSRCLKASPSRVSMPIANLLGAGCSALRLSSISSTEQRSNARAVRGRMAGLSLRSSVVPRSAGWKLRQRAQATIGRRSTAVVSALAKEPERVTLTKEDLEASGVDFSAELDMMKQTYPLAAVVGQVSLAQLFAPLRCEWCFDSMCARNPCRKPLN